MLSSLEEEAHVEIIRNSGLFDVASYQSRYGGNRSRQMVNPIYHYCSEGWLQGANPSPDFDTQFYLQENPDIRDSGMNPFVHYIVAGAEEQRDPNPRTRQERICRQIQSEVDAIRASGLFDEAFYRAMHPELEAICQDPIYHYCALGWREGKNPSSEFDGNFYRKMNPDIEEADLNPFLHYVQAGIRERRSPYPALTMKIAAQKDVWFGAVDTEIKLLAFYYTPDWSSFRERRCGLHSDSTAPLPANDVGFYDVTDPDVLRRQANLARRHGLHGFCFAVSPGELDSELPGPFKIFQRTVDINFHFCIQLDCQEEWPDQQQIAQLAEFMADPRYVRVDGRPLLVLMLPADGFENSSLRNCSALVERLLVFGLPSPYRVLRGPVAEALELDDPSSFMDALLDLPHHPLPAETGSYAPVLKNGLQLVPYQVVVAQGIHRAECGASAGGSLPSFHGITLRRHGFLPSMVQPLAYSRFELSDYRKWLCRAIDVVRECQPADRRVIFINSWNNWNQGQVLEPDQEYGFGCLNETTKALLRIDSDRFMPKVSVVVPNYNHAGYLKQRLESIYKQTYKNLEVLLLDDCSSDSSREILNSYAAANPEITRTIFNDQNSGGVFTNGPVAFKLLVVI